MYHHVKKLMYTVRVGEPDPKFGNMLLEQFGGANGELAAAMQYSIQGLNCDDPARKDLLMDIGTEELSHLEIVGTLARMHLQPTKAFREAAEVDPLIAIAGGGGVNLYNSMGNAWTADYLKITGELDVDLRSNIAAEARAKIVYERLINFCDDAGSREALQFLMTREITHMKAFAAALESMQRPAFSIGQIPPTADLVDKYFDDSTGQGDDGEGNARGPWNEGNGWQLVEAPAFQDLRDRGRNGPMSGNGRAFPQSDRLVASLAECLQDLLDAEQQLTKELPKLARAARSPELAQAFEQHLVETEAQVERVKQIFRSIGKKPKLKPCKGMAGLIAEGRDVIRDGKPKDDLAADLALIAAAQKVEHYEMSSYLSARALANQSGQSEAALLIGQSLLEEQQADKLLSRLATLLMEAEAMSGVRDANGKAAARSAKDETAEESTTAKAPKRRKRRSPAARR